MTTKPFTITDLIQSLRDAEEAIEHEADSRAILGDKVEEGDLWRVHARIQRALAFVRDNEDRWREAE